MAHLRDLPVTAMIQIDFLIKIKRIGMCVVPPMELPFQSRRRPSIGPDACVAVSAKRNLGSYYLIFRRVKGCFSYSTATMFLAGEHNTLYNKFLPDDLTESLSVRFHWQSGTSKDAGYKICNKWYHIETQCLCFPEGAILVCRLNGNCDHSDR